jgi:YhcN/YlaJ family sporulation lipoprotein
MNREASRIAQDAGAVQGVKKSTVVLSGRTAYVGLELEANVSRTKAKKVEQKVVDILKLKDPQVTTTVYVTSDKSEVDRLKSILQGISSGRPISNFSRDLQDIARRVKSRAS